MAKRYSGNLVVKIEYRDDGSYKGYVRGPGGLYRFSDLHAPAMGLGSGVAYDSPKAYDKMAQAAIGFATYDKEGLGYYEDDARGEPVVRRRTGVRRHTSKPRYRGK